MGYKDLLFWAITLGIGGGYLIPVRANAQSTQKSQVKKSGKPTKAKAKPKSKTKLRKLNPPKNQQSVLIKTDAPPEKPSEKVLESIPSPKIPEGGVIVNSSKQTSAAPAPLSQYKGRLSKAPRFAAQAREIAESGDFLTLRVFIRKNYSKLAHPADWILLRDLIIEYSDRLGYDLIYAWDKRLPGNYVDSGEMDINTSRASADSMMAEGRFQEAFDLYQKIAVELRRLRKAAKTEAQVRNINFLMPYIFQSMGRALYGAGRFDESYIVLRWIPPNFAKFRQVQFEKMWTAFRGGRIDQALGAVASQNSSYFSRYTSPEAYLVQTYIYKKLCRDEDYEQVLQEMYGYRDKLKANQLTIEEWVGSDNETRVLWGLANAKISKEGLVPEADLVAEQSRIRNLLDKSFAAQKSRMLDDLEKALAYVQLTVRSGSGNVLKPIEKLPDRSAFFDLDLEVWPADSLEEWADEIGTHRFIGDSLCAQKS